MQETILIISHDLSLARLAAQSLRCRLIHAFPALPTVLPSDLNDYSIKGLILLDSVPEVSIADEIDPLFREIPILALDCAAISLCYKYGGSVSDSVSDDSPVILHYTTDPLFSGVTAGEHLLREWTELVVTDQMTSIATASGLTIGFRLNDRPVYGIEYPLERNDLDSATILFNFATEICKCTENWHEEKMVQLAVEEIRRAAPDGNVLCAISGGVDSAVSAMLTSLAVGKRLICLYINTGLFRDGESDRVLSTFQNQLSLNTVCVNAESRFYAALSGIHDMHAKEDAAGSLMETILHEQVNSLDNIQTIVLGTNLNDLLHSGFYKAKDTPGMQTICRPVKNFFKEEIRSLANHLKLPSQICNRQPFPTSGLALRIMTDITPERLELVRKADSIFSDEVHAGGHDRKLWQFYASLGENPERNGTYIIYLRAVQSCQDGIKAARLPFDVMENAANRVYQELQGISRVVYDFTPAVHFSELE